MEPDITALFEEATRLGSTSATFIARLGLSNLVRTPNASRPHFNSLIVREFYNAILTTVTILATRYNTREDFLDSFKAHKTLYHDLTDTCLEEYGPRIWGNNAVIVTDGTNKLYPRRLVFEVRSDQEESVSARRSICKSDIEYDRIRKQIFSWMVRSTCRKISRARYVERNLEGTQGQDDHAASTILSQPVEILPQHSPKRASRIATPPPDADGLASNHADRMPEADATIIISQAQTAHAAQSTLIGTLSADLRSTKVLPAGKASQNTPLSESRNEGSMDTQVPAVWRKDASDEDGLDVTVPSQYNDSTRFSGPSSENIAFRPQAASSWRAPVAQMIPILNRIEGTLPRPIGSRTTVTDAIPMDAEDPAVTCERRQSNENSLHERPTRESGALVRGATNTAAIDAEDKVVCRFVNGYRRGQL
jgi:hypothetical protein